MLIEGRPKIGRGRVVPTIKDGDWTSVRQAINRLSTVILGSESTPTFAGVTISGSTASRLTSTDADKALTSTDLNAWVAGSDTINVTDDGDGSITLDVIPGGIDHGALAGLSGDDHGHYWADTTIGTRAKNYATAGNVTLSGVDKWFDLSAITVTPVIKNILKTAACTLDVVELAAFQPLYSGFVRQQGGTGWVQSCGLNSGSSLFRGGVAGDDYARFIIRSNSLEFGPGNAERDTILARTGLGELTLTSNFLATNFLATDGGTVLLPGIGVKDLDTGMFNDGTDFGIASNGMQFRTLAVTTGPWIMDFTEGDLLTFDIGAILSSTGAISFGNENLITTGYARINSIRIGDTIVPTDALEVSGVSVFGDGGDTNYTQFSATGYQLMFGTARVLRSVDFEPEAVKKGGVGPGTSTEAGFPIHDYSPTIDESIAIHWEIPHEYASAGEIHIHVEFFVDTAPVSAESVTWGVEYKKLSIGDIFDGSGSVTAIVNTPLTIGTPANNKKIHSSAEIQLVTTGFEPMDVVLIRIFRDANASEPGATDNYVGDARVFNYHLMYLSDKLGQST